MDSLGGAQVHVRDMALAMRKRGNDVSVLCGTPGPFTRQLEISGVRCLAVPGLQRSLNFVRDLRALTAIRRLILELRPDILSLHSSKAGWLGRIAGGLCPLPTVFTAHGWSFSGGLPPLRTWAYLRLEKLLSSRTQHLVCVSAADRELAFSHRLAPAGEIHLIHNGVPEIPPELVAVPGHQPAKIVMVARFQEPKDHMGLLRALAALGRRDWELDCVGDGPLQGSVKQLAVELGLADKVRFLGTCIDVAPILAEAQLFVLLSRREGFPRSILEAMRAGLPVLASDVGGIREAVVSGDNGFLVPAGDDGGCLRRYLEQMITSPGLRTEMGERGRARYLKEFSFQKMLKKTLCLYRQVLSAEP